MGGAGGTIFFLTRFSAPTQGGGRGEAKKKSKLLHRYKCHSSTRPRLQCFDDPAERWPGLAFGLNIHIIARNSFFFLHITIFFFLNSVTDWDLVEKVWEHAEDTRLKAKLSDHPVLLSEKPFNSSQSRMKYTVRTMTAHRTIG